MNSPLPASAFPIGSKGGASSVFVVAILVGLAMFLSARTGYSTNIPQR